MNNKNDNVNGSEAKVATVLVNRILSGDMSAETEMVERYGRGLRFMLRRRANNTAIAEDVAQETWRIVIEKIRAGALRDSSKLSAFIVQIGKNQLLMFFRSKKNQTISSDEANEEVIPLRQQPQQLLEKHNLKLVVNTLISELKKPRDRELLMRFYLREEDKETICHDFELSELHFNRVLFRARQRFKQLWLKMVETSL